MKNPTKSSLNPIKKPRYINHHQITTKSPESLGITTHDPEAQTCPGDGAGEILLENSEQRSYRCNDLTGCWVFTEMAVWKWGIPPVIAMNSQNDEPLGKMGHTIFRETQMEAKKAAIRVFLRAAGSSKI